MKTFIGIWIDRKKAVIVTKKRPDRNYKKDVEIAIAQTRSDVEGKVRLAGGSRTRNVPWGHQDIAMDRKIEAWQKQQLKKFYHRIFEVI